MSLSSRHLRQSELTLLVLFVCGFPFVASFGMQPFNGGVIVGSRFRGSSYQQLFSADRFLAKPSLCCHARRKQKLQLIAQENGQKCETPTKTLESEFRNNLQISRSTRETSTLPALNTSSTALGSDWIARITVLLVAALYGTNFGSIKILQESLPTSVAAALRFFLAAAVLAPFLTQVRKEAIRPGVEIGGLIAVGYIAQGIGLETADAGRAAFLCSLSVVVCPLLAALEGQPLKKSHWASVALAILGVAFIELGGSGPPTAGDFWLLLQPLAYGMAFHRTEAAVRRFPGQGLPLSAVQLAVVATAAAVWALGEQHGVPSWGDVIAPALQSPVVVAALVWTGVVTTALTTLLETLALQRLSSSETTLLYSTEPVWGAAFAHAVLGERLGPSGVAGGALILAACLSRLAGATGTIAPREDPPPHAAAEVLWTGMQPPAAVTAGAEGFAAAAAVVVAAAAADQGGEVMPDMVTAAVVLAAARARGGPVAAAAAAAAVEAGLEEGEREREEELVVVR